MKSIIPILIIITLFGCTNSQESSDQKKDNANLNNLVFENNLWYLKENKIPFSGNGLSYFENGEIENETSFIDGKLDGYLTTFYPNGIMEQKIHYINGLENDTSLSYYDNGQLEALMIWKDGLEEGYCIFYFKTGIQKSFEIYKDGKLVDSSFSFFENGQIESKGYFKDGLKDGRFVYYDSTSREIDGYQIFKNDSLIETIRN